MSVRFSAQLHVRSRTAIESAARYFGGKVEPLKYRENWLLVWLSPPQRQGCLPRVEYCPQSQEIAYDTDFVSPDLVQRFMDRAIAEEIMEQAQQLYPEAFCQILECGQGFEVDIQFPEQFLGQEQSYYA